MILATDCNFSMAVAHHAVELKIPAFVIMPSCCSSPRLRIYRDYGAMVISYGSTGRDSQNHARHLAKENGYLYLEESVLKLTFTFYTQVTCLSYHQHFILEMLSIQTVNSHPAVIINDCTCVKTVMTSQVNINLCKRIENVRKYISGG